MAWTPQQDLEEESSSDDLESPLNSSKNATSNIPGAKFSTRGQLFANRDPAFSMSLPREERIGIYPENNEAKVRIEKLRHMRHLIFQLSAFTPSLFRLEFICRFVAT